MLRHLIIINRRGISPVSQMFGTFWVKNENNEFSTCLRYKENYFRNNLDRRKTTENCDAKHTYVCEKNLN